LRVRRLGVPDGVGRQPDDLDRVDRPHERARHRRGADVTEGAASGRRLARMAATAIRDDTVTLPDGRALAYVQRGDPAGQPVLYFHGIPGSRLDAWGPDDLVARLGVRLVAVDRPGFGRSDPWPGRRLLDWPADVVHLTDAL